jgi:hypothetical protein
LSHCTMPDSGNGSIAKRRRDDERYAEEGHPDNKGPKISDLTKGAQQENHKDVRRSGRSNGRPDYAAMSSYGSKTATGSTAAKGFIDPEAETPLVSDDEDGQDDNEVNKNEEGEDEEEDEEEGEDEEEDEEEGEDEEEDEEEGEDEDEDEEDDKSSKKSDEFDDDTSLRELAEKLKNMYWDKLRVSEVQEALEEYTTKAIAAAFFVGMAQPGDLKCFKEPDMEIPLTNRKGKKLAAGSVAYYNKWRQQRGDKMRFFKRLVEAVNTDRDKLVTFLEEELDMEGVLTVEKFVTMLVELYQEEIFNPSEDEDEGEDKDGEDESYFINRVAMYLKENVMDFMKGAIEKALKLVEEEKTVEYFWRNFGLAPGLRPVVRVALSHVDKLLRERATIFEALAAILAQVAPELEEMGDELKSEDTDMIWHHVRTNLDENKVATGAFVAQACRFAWLFQKMAEAQDWETEDWDEFLSEEFPQPQPSN